MAKKKKKDSPGNVAAQNRRARYDFFITDTLEAGLILKGSEVKSLREGRASIGEAYAAEQTGELWLLNAYIPDYTGASTFGHEPRARRKLLLHHREIKNLANAVQRKGMTLIPLKIYFNNRGIAKVLLGLGEGKQQHDKRQAIKHRDWSRQKALLLREKR